MTFLLDVQNLSLQLNQTPLFQNISFQILPGETIGIIGESGSGKTLTALSLLGLIPGPLKKSLKGEIYFQGENLVTKSEKEMQKLRGKKIGMIFQDPMSSLNPTMTIGNQLIEGLLHHEKISRQEAQQKALEILELVEISDPKFRIHQYPYQLSGGMRQRIMIGIAIACGPELLIADEPTTSLDVTIQAQIIQLLKNLKKKQEMSILMISHDLAVIAGLCEKVIVMYQGKIVESGPIDQVFYQPKHSYTQTLLKNCLTIEKRVKNKKSSLSLIEVYDLSKTFTIFGKSLTAFSDVNLSIDRGETLGLIGESGSGKSTLAKTILHLEKRSTGNIFFQEIDPSSLKKNEMQKMRQKMQIIFQNPYTSLNPRMTVEKIIEEPLMIHGLRNKATKQNRILELLDLVELPKEFLSKYPHEMSGGQCQRISIARTLALEPEFIICDEPLSSLDASTQLKIMQLLKNLQDQFNLAYLFIGHDLTKVAHLSDRIAVMYLGKIVETGPSQKIYQTPLHPYTQALISAIPIPDPIKERNRLPVLLKGHLPSPFKKPQGCVFHQRCPHAQEVCEKITPSRTEVEPGHFVECHFFKAHASVEQAGD